jgi:excinuclease UvrABC ATPase subunit
MEQIFTAQDVLSARAAIAAKKEAEAHKTPFHKVTETLDSYINEEMRRLMENDKHEILVSYTKTSSDSDTIEKVESLYEHNYMGFLEFAQKMAKKYGLKNARCYFHSTTKYEIDDMCPSGDGDVHRPAIHFKATLT